MINKHKLALLVTASALVCSPAVCLAQQTPPTSVDELIITGRQSYAPQPTGTATKTDTPLFETPQAVQVVSRQVLEDQAALTLQDATRNVAGVQAAFGFFGINNACVRVRGFSTEQGSVGCTFYIDGVRMWAQPLPIASMEAVEVVKGPNTVLYGRNEPGGMVNVVTRSPTPEPVRRASVWGGSFNTYGATVDLGGALNESKTLSGRLNAAYSYTDTFRDRAFDELTNINLGLTWRPDEMTSITAKIDWSDSNYRPDFGVPALGTRPAPVPVTQSYMQTYVDSTTDAVSLHLAGERRFNDHWKLRASGFASWIEPNYFSVSAYGLDEATNELSVLYFAEQFSERRTYQANIDLIGDVELLGVKHNLLIGAEYNDERYDGPIWFDGVAPNLDLFNPQIGTAPKYYPVRSDFSPYGSVQEWTGLYVQDQIHLSDKLIVNVGGRYDRATNAFSPNPVADAVTEDAFKPRVGAVYLIQPNLSLYAQYQEAFGPNNGRSSTGVSFPGQTAVQTEIGAKWQSEGGGLLATLALYDLRKQNLLTADLSTADPTDRIAVGEVRNRGVEVDVSGRLTKRVSVIASYAYSDAETTRDNNGYQGNRYEGVPRHAGSIWARYQATEKVALGGGLFAEGDRPGDLSNSFTLPGYARVDLFAEYGFSVGDARYKIQVNVNNILDERYYAGVYKNSRDYILPGAPRGVMLTLRSEF